MPPPVNAQPSAEALAQAVLSAVAAGDRDRLEQLALTEQEFRDHVWPHLPAARPERNLPFSYVWGELRQKSGESLARTLAQRHGRRYTLSNVVFQGGTTDYPGARVHRQAVFTVRDSSGNGSSIRLCGSFLEQSGRWRVFSYVVDD